MMMIYGEVTKTKGNRKVAWTKEQWQEYNYSAVQYRQKDWDKSKGIVKIKDEGWVESTTVQSSKSKNGKEK